MAVDTDVLGRGKFQCLPSNAEPFPYRKEFRTVNCEISKYNITTDTFVKWEAVAECSYSFESLHWANHNYKDRHSNSLVHCFGYLKCIDLNRSLCRPLLYLNLCDNTLLKYYLQFSLGLKSFMSRAHGNKLARKVCTIV